MDLTILKDFVKSALGDVGQYKLERVFLSPDKLRFVSYVVPSLNWNSIPFGEAQINNIPNDKRGVYAFVLREPNAFLPPHGYVLYIGIAGRKSKRSLRTRYRDYLNPAKVIKRDRIARMIGTWSEVLHFYFSPVDDTMSSADLEKLEEQLNGALMPPCSEGDLDADTKRKRRAFS